MDNTSALLQFLAAKSKSFQSEFEDLLDWVSDVIEIQGTIGFNEAALAKLPQDDRDLVVTYVALMNGMDTTLLGLLHMLGAGLVSDGYALARTLFESYVVMAYGNREALEGAPDCRTHVVDVLGRGVGPADKQGHREQELVRVARHRLLEGHPAEKQLRELLRFINNFGSHLSRAKILGGNSTSKNGRLVSAAAIMDHTDGHLLRCLSTASILFLSANVEYFRALSVASGNPLPQTSPFDQLEQRYMQHIEPGLRERFASRVR